MLLEQARAYVLAGNDLPIVWTPSQTLRNDRELVRGRLKTADQLAPVIGSVLLELIERYETLKKAITTLDRHLRHLAKTNRYVKPVAEIGPSLT